MTKKPDNVSIERIIGALRFNLIKHRLDWLAITFLALLTTIFFWRVVFLGEVLLPLDKLYITYEPWKSESQIEYDDYLWNSIISDSMNATYPAAVYVKETYQQGGHFWDPYPLGGLPALARGELMLNPFFIILSAFLPVAQALSWMTVLHIFMGSIFMFMFMRELGVKQFGALVGSLVFIFNTYLVVWMTLTTLINTMIWLPVVFWGTERALRRADWRWILVSAVGFALQIYSGFIMWPFYAAITLVLYSLARSILIWLEDKNLIASSKPILYSCFALGLGTLLAMPQLLPTIQLFFQTARTEQIGATASLSIRTQFLRLFAPNVYGNYIRANIYRGPINYPETTLYFGILALLFIIAGAILQKRRVIWIWIGIGLMAILAVGNVFPFRQIAATLYPILLNSFPGRIFYITTFSWAVAAGLGADWIVIERPSRHVKSISQFAIVLASIFLFLTAMISATIFRTYWRSKESVIQSVLNIIAKTHIIAESRTIIRFETLLTAAFFLLVSACILWAWNRQIITNRIFKVFCLGLIAIDLFIVGIGYNPSFDPKYVFPETPSLRYMSKLLHEETGEYRMLDISSRVLLPGMTSEIYHLSTISGYSSWVQKRYLDYANLTGDMLRTTIAFVYFNNCCSRLVDAMGVKYVYTSPDVKPVSSGVLDLTTHLDEAETSEDSRKVAFTSWELDGISRNVIFAPPPTRLTYNLSITRPAIFRTGLAINPASWEDSGDGVVFKVLVKTNNSNEEELILSRTIDPQNNPADRNYLLLEADLSPYIGQQISISLVTDPGPNENARYDWAGWVEPHIENYFESSLSLIYDGPNKIYENTKALPRAWAVRQIQAVAPNDVESVKEYLRSPDFEPTIEAVVETDAPIDQFGLNPASYTREEDEIKITSYAAEHVTIEADMKAAGLLILSDTMYPGWKAYVDGVERPIYVTNLIMRGVFLEPGAHQVEFIYEATVFYVGLVIASLTFISMIIALLRTWYISKQRTLP